MFKTKTDFNYEIGAAYSPNDNSAFKLEASFVSNFRFDEAVQVLYDEDGAVFHGTVSPNDYDSQLLAMIKMRELELGGGNLFAEILYGNNIGGDINSGNSFGFSARYNIGVNNEIIIPIGLIFGYFEKNIDILAHTAVNNKERGTVRFRDNINIGLGTGIQYDNEQFRLDVNLGAAYNIIKHYYRDDIQILKLSLDTIFTWDKKVFVGAGFLAGTLYDVRWKTKDDTDPTLDSNGFDHTFTFGNNYAFEVFAGLNLSNNSKFVIGFNRNMGLTLNNMIEAKVEGQVKYKQPDTNWDNNNQLIEAGGLYVKFELKY
jgi:hypothetical protein